MGYREAIADGIRIVNGNNFEAYYPKCHICGEEVQSMNYLRNVNYTCKNCKLDIYIADKKMKLDYSYDAKERKFKKSKERLSRMGINIYSGKYKTAIDKVYSKLHTYGWFDSTEEIITAIELEKNEIKYRHQVKFGKNFRADFVLDDEKIILEIDGVLFHTNDKKEKEDIRDGLILLSLGSDWEVVRVTDEDINLDIEALIPTILNVRDAQKKLRIKYGHIPKWADRKKY